MNVPLKLHNDRIAVVPIRDEVTPGGLQLPQGNVRRELPVLRGEVVAIGPGQFIDGTNMRPPMPVELGDIVHYLGAHTVEVIVANTKFHIIDLSTLICIEDIHGNTGTIDETD